MRGRHAIGYLARGAVLAGALLLLVHMVDLRSVGRQLCAVPPWLLAAAVLIALLRIVLSGLRWWLLTPSRPCALRPRDCIRYALVANTFTLLMPGALGGDLVRAALVLDEVRQERAALMVSIVVDRVVGLTSIMLLAVAAILASPQVPHKTVLLAAVAAALAALACALALVRRDATRRVLCAWASHAGRLAPRCVAAVAAAHAAVVAISGKRVRVLSALLLCIPIHLLWFVIVYLLARHLNIAISFLTACSVTALVWLITTLPLSLAGVGVRELSYVYLLGMYGVSADAATALSLAQFAIMVVSALLGIPFIVHMGRPAPHPVPHGDPHD